MHILITGANGFMGRNLTHALRNARPDDVLHLIDLRSTLEERQEASKAADFVFHLAGINRPQDPSEFMQGNCDYTQTLLDSLAKHPPRFQASHLASSSAEFGILSGEC